MAGHLRVSTSRTDVERGIAPPMLKAVTLPLKVDNQHTSIILYVCVGAFVAPGAIPLDGELQAIAVEIARRINSGGA